LQVNSIQAIHVTLGAGGSAWRKKELCRIVGGAAPIARTHGALTQVDRNGLDESQLRILDEVVLAAGQALNASVAATRAGLMAVFMGHEGRSEDPDQDYRRAVQVQLHGLNAAITSAMLASGVSVGSGDGDARRARLRAEIADASKELGTIDPVGKWLNYDTPPEWPGTVLMPASQLLRSVSFNNARQPAHH
jgi:hypothetical protein